MPTEESDNVKADGGKIYLVTQASLNKLIGAIKAQRPIAGNGISLNETPQGIVVNSMAASGIPTITGTQTFYNNMSLIPQPDCSMTCCAFSFQNPFSSSATMTVSGSVDDDLMINGVIPDFGQFPFFDLNGCPGSGFLNGAHAVNYTTTVLALQIINFLVIGNFRGFMGFSGSVAFTAP